MTTIFITGVSSGLGKAIVERLAEENNVYMIGLHRSLIPSEFTQMKRADFIQYDLAETAALPILLENFFNSYLNSNSSIVFINNAGTIGPIGITSATLDAIQENIAVNLTAPIIIYTKLKQLFSNVKVVNISSGAADRPIAGWEMYCATKSGMKSFFEVAALDEAATVLNYNPGVMDTAMQAQIRKSSTDEFTDHDKFVALKNDGSLKSTDEVANHLVNTLIGRKFISL